MNAYLTLSIPSEHVEVAKRISRALDPDVGGYEGFQLRAMKDGTEYAVYGFPCTAEFAANAQLFKSAPEALQQAVNTDYSNRWPDLPQLGDEDVRTFCSFVLMSEAYGTLGGVSDLGLTLTEGE